MTVTYRMRGGAVAAALALSASLLTGCAGDDGAENDTGVTEEAEQAEQPTDDEAAEQTVEPDSDDGSAADGDDADGSGEAGSLAAQDAATIALDEVSGAVVEIDRNDDGAILVWEVLVRDTSGNGVEVDVDASSGEVRDRDEEDLPDEAVAAAPRVTAAQAMDTAVGEVVGGVVHDLELDDDDNRIVWEVEVRGDSNRVDVTIDASTGEVLDTDVDDE